MIKSKVISLMTSVCLMCGLILPANAEEQTMIEVQPLLDSVAAAVLSVDDTAEISPDFPVTAALADAFLVYAKSNNVLPANSPVFADISSELDCIRSVFGAEIPGYSPSPDFSDASSMVCGVRPQSVNVSPDGDTVQIIGDAYRASKPLADISEDDYSSIVWLNKVVNAEFRRSDVSPFGWTVSSFSMNGHFSVDASTDSYFSSRLMEYYNESAGFSVDYPIDFMDYLQQGDNGISGNLEDGSASFFAIRESFTANSIAELEALVRSKYPEGAITVYDVTCSVRVQQKTANSTQLDVYLLGSSSVFHMQLIYNDSLEQDYSMYAEYMTNSFISLENMVG